MEEVGDAVVDGAVSVAHAYFHETDDLLQLLLADAVADAVAGLEDFCGEDATLAVCPGDEALADDAFERTGELGGDLRLLVGGENIDDAVDGLRGICGVEGGEDEVAGLGGGEGDADGFEIPEFGDDDDVWVLAQCLAEGERETAGVAADFALFDKAGAVFVDELDGVFEGNDDAIPALRDALDHGGEGGGFPGTGDAGDKDEAAAEITKIKDGRVVAECF